MKDSTRYVIRPEDRDGEDIMDWYFETHDNPDDAIAEAERELKQFGHRHRVYRVDISVTPIPYTPSARELRPEEV